MHGLTTGEQYIFRLGRECCRHQRELAGVGRHPKSRLPSMGSPSWAGSAPALALHCVFIFCRESTVMMPFGALHEGKRAVNCCAENMRLHGASHQFTYLACKCQVTEENDDLHIKNREMYLGSHWFPGTRAHIKMHAVGCDCFLSKNKMLK